MNYLVILESPNKIIKVKKYLEESFPEHKFNVQASMGHITELTIGNQKYPLGIKTENMAPIFNVSSSKVETVKKLKTSVSNVDKVILATDPDREGEAIAWHLQEQLECQNKAIRMTFNEITYDAIKQAFKQQGKIDLNLVYAQISRQELDRIIGFELSGFVMKQDNSLRSAGRVQSVALKLIVDVELERQKHNKLEYWTIKTKYKDENYINLVFDKHQNDIVEQKIITSEEMANQIKSELSSELKVVNIEVENFKENKYKPVTTSDVLQLANIKLDYSSQETTNYLQHLFENGYITYPRTDSTRLNPDFVEKVQNWIKQNCGENYVGNQKTVKSKDNIQDAHEAIRPTDIALSLEQAKKNMNYKEFVLYELIWQNTLFSLMAPSIGTTHKVAFNNNGYTFELEYDNYDFLSFYELTDEIIPTYDYQFEIGQIVQVQNDYELKQNFTKPKQRYNEATLIKKLEVEGVGRPSTYATILKTLLAREYVQYAKKSLVPTEKGIIVSQLLQKYFSDFINEKYTAEMETQLDQIANNQINHNEYLKRFYKHFMTKKSEVVNELNKDKPKCKKCNIGYIVPKTSRTGSKFLACDNFPNCKNIVS